MDRNKIIKLMQEKNVQSYSFSIAFFVIFSLFVYFAIRPNLITAFNLQKELRDLRLKNKQFEEQILQIVNYQTTIEEYRDEFSLLDEAVPQSPQVVKVLDDIKKSANESGLVITALTMESIEYTEDKEQFEEVYSFNVSTSGSIGLTQISTFFDTLVNQRRIKTIDTVNINRETDTSAGEQQYTISMTIRGHYL